MRDEVRNVNEVQRKNAELMEQNAEKKRKADYDKIWEETRSVRVDSWRSFQTKKKKKKKDKF